MAPNGTRPYPCRPFDGVLRCQFYARPLWSVCGFHAGCFYCVRQQECWFSRRVLLPPRPALAHQASSSRTTTSLLVAAWAPLIWRITATVTRVLGLPVSFKRCRDAYRLHVRHSVSHSRQAPPSSTPRGKSGTPVFRSTRMFSRALTPVARVAHRTLPQRARPTARPACEPL